MDHGVGHEADPRAEKTIPQLLQIVLSLGHLLEPLLLSSQCLSTLERHDGRFSKIQALLQEPTKPWLLNSDPCPGFFGIFLETRGLLGYLLDGYRGR